jgi:hypothetical protein
MHHRRATAERQVPLHCSRRVRGWFAEGVDPPAPKEAKALLDKLNEPAIAANSIKRGVPCERPIPADPTIRGWWSGMALKGRQEPDDRRLGNNRNRCTSRPDGNLLKLHSCRGRWSTGYTRLSRDNTAPDVAELGNLLFKRFGSRDPGYCSKSRTTAFLDYEYARRGPTRTLVGGDEKKKEERIDTHYVKLFQVITKFSCYERDFPPPSRVLLDPGFSRPPLYRAASILGIPTRDEPGLLPDAGSGEGSRPV